MGCHFLLQGIFPTQEGNPGLLHCRQILYQLSYKGNLGSEGSSKRCYLVTGVALMMSLLMALSPHRVQLLTLLHPSPCPTIPPDPHQLTKLHNQQKGQCLHADAQALEDIGVLQAPAWGWGLPG